MTQINNKAFKEILQEAIEEDGDFMKELLKFMFQQILEYERDNQIGVELYERDEEKRKGSRNGYKDRSLNTRLGRLKLHKPQIREFPFSTRIFDNYQRSEKALLLAIQQMVIDGVSTEKVKKITKKLSEEMSFSKSTVSRLMKELDPMVEKWRTEKLNEHYAYLISDAVYFHIRENGQVLKRPLLISGGIDKDGRRKVLGLNMAYQEDDSSWKEHMRELKERGIKEVGLTTSDANKGLVKALEEEFPGTPHQRCMVHFERDILAKVPAKERKKLSRYLKQIYNAPDKEMALTVAQLIVDKYRNTYPKVSRLLEKHLEETLTFYSYPSRHHRKVRTTNLIEYLNKIIKKRSRVIGIFPNAESCIRYVSCLLMEIDEDWQTGRRYMRMDYLDEDESNKDEEFMEEIKKVKERSKLNKELVAQ
ncbi:MAG: IS256 family transposase [candidate division WOR-3 bacterium]|nr:IS256 family transposase [candidate division WOR-3 bacterium]